MKYGYSKKVNLNFDEAVNKTREVLKQEGFGVLTEIDVQATLKEKLNVDFDKYLILGACNPLFAHKALLAEKEIGLLLPCNVIIYLDGGDVYVSAILPATAMSFVENKTLKVIALTIQDKLKRVVNNI